VSAIEAGRDNFLLQNQIVESVLNSRYPACPVDHRQTLEFVIDLVIRKCSAACADSKVERS